jgi:hypothetical protein
MNKKLGFWLCFAALVVVLSCRQNDRRDIKSYYFPIFEMRDGLVYGYDMTIRQGDHQESLVDYWYYRSIVRDTGTYLIGTNYTPDYEVSQIVTEKITSTGAVARAYHMYEPDSATNKSIMMRSRLDNGDVFPFEVRDSLGVFLFSISYWDPEHPDERQYLIRNRRYLGDGPDFEFEGRTYKTIRLKVQEILGNESEGSAEIPANGEEWYAKGLGLVYSVRKFGQNGQIQRTYRLRERLTMDELSRRANKNIAQ